MPAANLTQLFDFEGQFESAAIGILRNVLINAYATGQDEQLPGENTGVAFDLGPATEGKFAQLTKPASWPANQPPPQEYFIYTATLEFRVEVPRDDRQPTTSGVNSMLSQIRGKLREEMMQCVRPFNEVNLPFYKVARIRPSSTSTQQNAAKNSDITFIRYEIAFEIRSDRSRADYAWPAWVEA